MTVSLSIHTIIYIYTQRQLECKTAVLFAASIVRQVTDEEHKVRSCYFHACLAVKCMHCKTAVSRIAHAGYCIAIKMLYDMSLLLPAFARV